MRNVVTTEKYSDLLNKRKKVIEKVISFIETNREAIRNILTEVTLYQTAEDEIDTSIKVLRNSFKEVSYYKPPVLSSLSVFMPSNVLLYSYVLYLLVPSLYVRKIEFRPSTQVFNQVKKIHELLSPIHNFPIELVSLSHKAYIEQSVRKSQVIVFTGSYKNAEKIKAQLDEDQMFIFLGQGINPFIISENANLEKAIDDLITIRLYNSGQDCLGPDVIYVPNNIKENLLNMLMEKLSQLKFGEMQNPSSDYGPIFYQSALDSVSTYLNKYNDYIYFGGIIDYSSKTIHPTILLSNIEDKLTISEFFSPIFNIVTYNEWKEIEQLLCQGYFLERALGASIYGKVKSEMQAFLMKRHTVSINQTLLDIENGNQPFGGFGPMANYISYRKKLYIEPILISKALNNYWVEI